MRIPLRPKKGLETSFKAKFFYLMILSKKNPIFLPTLGRCCHIFTAFIKLLRIIKWKKLSYKVSDFDCFFNFCFKLFLIQQFKSNQKFNFLGETPDPDFSFDLLY